MEIHPVALVLAAIVTLVTVYFGFTTPTRSLPVAILALVITIFACVQIFSWWLYQNQNLPWTAGYTFVAWISLAAGIRQFLVPIGPPPEDGEAKW